MANILLVDDDHDVLVLAQKVLETANHHVESTQDALSALDLLTHTYFDVLISDANMPHYTGFDLLKQLRKDERFNSLSLVMLTGRREKEDIEKAIRIGIDDYIVKPIEPLVFLRKVESIISRRPVEKKVEIPLGQTSIATTAYMRTKIRIITVSEEGMCLRSNEPAPLGSFFDMDSDFFLSLGVQPPTMKVVSCLPDENVDAWELRVQYVEIREKTLQKIRSWIISNSPQLISKKKAA